MLHPFFQHALGLANGHLYSTVGYPNRKFICKSFAFAMGNEFCYRQGNDFDILRDQVETAAEAGDPLKCNWQHADVEYQ